jgi:membrane associated rhomboid family serine protease
MLIPLSDASRRPMTFPFVTAAIIAVNVLVFIAELAGGDDFVNKWSLIPANISSGTGLITIVTSMFMHASWSHILGNMVFLWAFGPEMEDMMGPLRYVIFYLVGGVIAMLAQVIADPHSSVPNLGASGAIAAVMGGFLVTFPRDRIKSVLFLGWFFKITLIPAALLIVVWFLLQLVSVGSITDAQGGGVAYLAHIGGTIYGVAAARLFEGRKPIAPPDDAIV